MSLILEVVKYTNVAFGTDESVLFREVSLIQGVLIERFHCIHACTVCTLNIGMTPLLSLLNRI